MKQISISSIVLLLSIVVSGCATQAPSSLANKLIPKSWIDPDTGHKVVRLSEEAGSRSLYFHQNAYAASGDKMVISIDSPKGVAVVDLNSLDVKSLYTDPDIGVLFMGPKGREVYLTQIPAVDGQVVHPQNELQSPTKILAVNIDTGAVREVATIARGKIHSINSDESLLIGAFAEQEHNLETGPRDKRFEARYEATDADGNPLSFADAKEVRMDERLEKRIPMQMFTVNIQNGEQKTILKSTDWLNHIQFAPHDPELVMYAHEGPWHKVDRIWLTDINGKSPQKIHTRMMNMEIAGHEFWRFDGKEIFYDLQTPRGEDFWLASYNLETGERVWRHMERDEWSVHFNISRDGKLFAGDGGDSEMVAKAKDGKWIYLFDSVPVKDVAGISARNAKDLIKPAKLNATKLVNMQNHDYRLEPNITFTPDGKWLVFRSNMHGPVHVYAVEIAKH